MTVRGLTAVTRRFFDSLLYPAVCMLLILIGHETALDVPFAILTVLLGAMALLVSNEVRTLLPQICGFILVGSVKHTPNIPSHSDYYAQAWVIVSAGITALLLLCAILIFAIRNRHRIERPTRPSLLPALLAWCAALLLGGIGYTQVFAKDLIFAVGIVASLILPYLLFVLYGHRTREDAEYFLYCLMLAGLVVLCELIVAYLTSVRFDGMVPVKESVLLGWGFWTHIGTFFTFSLPCAFWFARTRRQWLGYFFIGCALFIGILMSAGRGAMLFGSLLLALCLALLFFGGRNKRKCRIAILTLLGCTLLALLLLSGKIIGFLSEYLRFGLGDNGRFALYRLALENFLKAPVLGVGYFTSGIESPWVQSYPYLYHNTLLQMLASGGVLGAGAYLYHRIDTVRLAIKKRRDPLSLFLLLVALAVTLSGLLDEHIFHIYPAMIYAVALYYAEGDYREQ